PAADTSSRWARASNDRRIRYSSRTPGCSAAWELRAPAPDDRWKRGLWRSCSIRGRADARPARRGEAETGRGAFPIITTHGRAAFGGLWFDWRLLWVERARRGIERFPHRAGQRIRRDGLAEEAASGEDRSGAGKLVVGVSGHEDQVQIGTNGK